MIYYRISFWDVVALALTAGWWVVWVIARGDEIEKPAEQ